jgi:hypothetical protein
MGGAGGDDEADDGEIVVAVWAAVNVGGGRNGVPGLNVVRNVAVAPVVAGVPVCDPAAR